MRKNETVTDSSPALPTDLIRSGASVTCSPEPTVREIRRSWTPGAVVGLVFLVFPAIDFISDDYTAWQRACGLTVVAVLGLSYLLVTPAMMTWSINRQLLVLGGLVVVSFGLWPLTGSGLTATWIYIGIMAGATMSMRNTTIVALVLAVGMLLLGRIDDQAPSLELAGVLIGLSLWMCGFMGNIRLTRELQRTRQELAVAAVAAERVRIGRDLHDILGHSLTAITVKAGLARRLLEQSAEGAAAEIADIERMAREALADVRATASGYREVSLGSEISVAAAVLRAAGITPTLPQAVEHVQPAARELFGYVVREAVTNVVRHSQAGHCTITVGVDTVEIRDDGVGADCSDPVGSGLQGLGARVREAGGTLDAGPVPSGGFSVRATLPDPAVVAVGQPLLAAGGETTR